MKKAFTLIEILLVMLVIGIIATLTVTTIIRSVIEAQIKASYKKALNSITNIASTEKVAGSLPITNKPEEMMRFFKALNNNLSPNSYVSTETLPINSKTLATNTNYSTAIKIDDKTYGTSANATIKVSDSSITTSKPSPWIITDENMAYSILPIKTTGTNKTCKTIAQIAGKSNQSSATLASCALIIVDINGLSRGPNSFDTQVGPKTGIELDKFNSPLSENYSLNPLTGDQYIIFLGSDGATAGPKITTVGGRIAADIK